MSFSDAPLLTVENLRTHFLTDPDVQRLLPGTEQAVKTGAMTVAHAAEELLTTFERRHHRTEP